MATQADFSVIDNLIDELKNMPVHLKNIADDVVAETKSDIIEILSKTPPPTGTPQRKIEWTSEKQRRAYFATDGFGAGIPYVRKSKNGNIGWELFTVPNSDKATIVIMNQWSGAKYVIGQFSGVSPMQRFHQITGWESAIFGLPEVQKILIDATQQIASDYFSNLWKRL